MTITPFFLPNLLLTTLCAVALAMPGSAQTLKKGPWSRDARLPDGWVLHHTKNYQIQSQVGEEKAIRLGKHMEAMNKVYRRMFRPDKRGGKRYTIKMFKDRKGFARYGQAPGAAAYYSATDREMVCYDTGKWSDEPKITAPATGGGDDSVAARLRRRLERMEGLLEMDLLGVMGHEGWHQYFHWYVTSWVELPSWIDEGMGDYFYTAAPKKVKGRQIPAELGRDFPGRMLIIKQAVAQGRHIPVSEIIWYSQAEYYSNPTICYAQGWALCQFLLHSKNKKYNKVIRTFIRLVRDDTNMEVVTNKAFKGIDFDKLEEEFVAWVKAMKLPGDDEGPDTVDASGDKNSDPDGLRN